MYSQDQWDEYLPAAEFAYNNSKQASTGFTPFELDCGQHLNTPITMTKEFEIPVTNDFLKHWTSMIDLAKDSLREAQERQEKYANEHRRHIIFQVGDQVLLNMKNTNTPVDRNHPTKKLTPRFAGPYLISKEIGRASCRERVFLSV